MDDKSWCFLIVFGLHLAHENEALFGVRAAIKMRDGLIKAPHIGGFSIGVATGNVFIGEIGTFSDIAPRRDHIVMGPTVNLAARLMAQKISQNNILCDRLTTERCSDDFELQPHELQLKGIQGMTTASLVVGIKEKKIGTRKSLNFNKIVGRDTERSQVDELISEWKAGKQRTLIISGSTGIGKSDFLASFFRQSVTLDIVLCSVEASEVEMSSNLSSLREVFMAVVNCALSDTNLKEDLKQYFATTRSVLAHSIQVTTSIHSARSDSQSFFRVSKDELKNDGDLHSPRNLQSPRNNIQKQGYFQSLNSGTFNDLNAYKLQEKLQQFLSIFQEHLASAPLFNVILPIAMPDTVETMRFKGKYRIIALKDIVIRTLKAFSSVRQIALVFDNLQWLDSSSWDVLEAIIRDCPRILVVGLTRPLEEYTNDIVATQYKRVCGRETTKILELKPLTLENTERIIVNYFPAEKIHSVDKRILNAVFERAEGNAFLTNLLASAVSQRATVSQDNPTPIVMVKENRILPVGTEGLAFDNWLPSGSKGAIIAQFDRLEPRFQEILKFISIFEQNCTVGDVHKLMSNHAEICIGGAALSEHDIGELIQEGDIFCFLTLNHQENTGEDQNINNQSLHLSFKSRTVERTLAELWPQKISRDLHRYIANAYAQELCEANKHVILSRIRRHYELASDLDNYIKYTEEFGFYCSSILSVKEAVESFEALKRIVEERHLTKDPRFTVLRRVDWELQLAKMRLNQRDLTGALELLGSALRILKKPVPFEKNGNALAYLFKEVWKQIKYRRKAKLFGVHYLDFDNDEREVMERVYTIFDLVEEIGFHSVKIPLILMSLFTTLNLAEELATKDNSVRLGFQSAVFASIFKSIGILPGISESMLHRAMFFLDKFPDDELHGKALKYIHFYHLTNDLEAALEVALNGQAIFEASGLKRGKDWGDISWLVCIVFVLQGKFNEALSLAQQMSSMDSDNIDPTSLGTISSDMICRTLYLLGRNDELPSERARLMVLNRVVEEPPYIKLFGGFTVILISAGTEDGTSEKMMEYASSIKRLYSQINPKNEGLYFPIMHAPIAIFAWLDAGLRSESECQECISLITMTRHLTEQMNVKVRPLARTLCHSLIACQMVAQSMAFNTTIAKQTNLVKKAVQHLRKALVLLMKSMQPRAWEISPGVEVCASPYLEVLLVERIGKYDVMNVDTEKTRVQAVNLWQILGCSVRATKLGKDWGIAIP